MTAARTTSFAPEQCDGTVDGHSFYFRERHGVWSIEVDLQANGRFARRFVGVEEDGQPMTEPVELRSGEVIAEGVDTDLGESPTEHLDFIVRTIRHHLRVGRCDHAGALFFCPQCGARMSGPT